MSKKRITWIVIACVLGAALIAGAVIYVAVILPQRKAHDEQMRLVREYYDSKVALYEHENEQYDDYELDVAIIGDSLTDGYDLKKYYPQYVTANRGIGGDTTFGLEERLHVSLYDLKPKVVVMLIGANNMDSMFDNYESILISLKENLPDSKIVLLSLTAMGGEHWGRKNELAAYNNVKIKLYAEKYGFTFIDLFSALYDVEIGVVYEGYTVDGGHFTHEGYVVVTNQITPILERLLGR